MKKKVLLILLIIILVISSGTIYLNKVILPTKIRALVIFGLQEATQKKVTLGSLDFNIFKGIVLRNLAIYDEEKTLVSIKEASCSIFIIPFFKKQIIIPSLRIKSAQILLVRRKDNTFNIQDLFAKEAPLSPKAGFQFNIYKLILRDAKVHFRDETFLIPFSKDIENLSLNVYFSLPVSAKFNLKAKLLSNPVTNITAAGTFRIPDQQWTGKISIQDFSPKDFSNYYQNSGVRSSSGLIDCWLNVKVKDNILYLGLAAQNKNLNINKEKLSAILNSEIKANIQYGLEDKTISFTGKSKITNMQISGLEMIGEAQNINGELTFNTLGLSADNLKATVRGIPIEAKVGLRDFSNPLLNINIISSLNLADLQDILKDKFRFTFLKHIDGGAKLFLDIQSFPSPAGLQTSGYLDIRNASLRLEKIESPLENINGRLGFTQNQLKWSDLTFRYLGIPYKTGGILTNFQAPGVQLALSSPDLFLQTNFNINNKLINLSKFSGKYLNSDFALAGDINTLTPQNLAANITGDLNVNLGDLEKIFKKAKTQLNKIKPSGLVHTQFNLEGNLNDFKSCSLEAKLTSSRISLWGLEADALLISCSQKEGRLNLPLIHLALYDGAIDGEAIINLGATNLPYLLAANLEGIKIEKLKMDTPVKKEDLTGTLQAQLKLEGLVNDLLTLGGSGRLYISEGKLWQLNLFQGLGKLLFAQDYFTNIIFNEGSCSFSIKDKYIWTEDLALRSNVANLSGSVKIGFDSSLDASLNVEVVGENIPLSGTFKDITTAIIGRSGKYGVIKIGGTLREPKYKFKPAVKDILKGLTDIILGN